MRASVRVKGKSPTGRDHDFVVPLVLRPDGAKLRVPCFVPLVGVFLAGAFFVVVAGWLREV